MDVIAVRDIRVHGRHGALPHEREREQPFDIDVSLECDLTAAAAEDDLRQTIDYAGVKADVERVVRETSFALLERLAAEVLEALFMNPRIVRAEVSIAKPAILDGATPSVALRRDNPRACR